VGSVPEQASGAPHAIPSGTVTFAFTDIEGSTERWERDPPAMQAAIRRHDDLLRTSIVACGGHVFKTIGDGFCAAFSRPQDAVDAMLGIQRALAGEDFSAVGGIRVRAALHTGTADERNGDYFGPAVNRVARLLAIGHGGQMLLSSATADVVRGDLPLHASLRDLGEHRLRDLTRPERVYQLVVPGLVADFPALRSVDAMPNNLPLQLNSFIGREREIADITSLVAAHRLVTLSGSGGVGKSRTSLQVAAGLLDLYRDGVWYVQLAPFSKDEYIPTAVAQALGLRLAAEGDPVADLLNALKRKKALLVFDNCEHLIESVARVVAAILRSCPEVQILASSRQQLGIEGEMTFRMPSLDVPSPGEALKLKAVDVALNPAAALFVERARAADQRFRLTDDNAPIVADVCRRLDGIPLAIELAAARVKMFSAKQVRERLDERFRILTGGSRDVLSRHKTLRALIDWSHDLLDERERALFRRLGIFVGGFTVEGAIAVGCGERLDEFEVVETLGSLVDKSLVLAEPRVDSVRYRLLETTRAYALEKLDAAGERAALADRHLRHLRVSFAEHRERSDRTGRKAEFVEALQADLDDVRSAVDGALAGPNVIEGAELLAAVGPAWSGAGLYAEFVARCERYLAVIPATETRILARITRLVSHSLRNSGKARRAYDIAKDALAYARAAGDPSILVEALCQLASTAVLLGLTREAESALAEMEAVGEISLTLRLSVLHARADLSDVCGDHPTAAGLYRHLREEFHSLGDGLAEVIVSGNLAETEHVLGRTDRALATVREALLMPQAIADLNHRSYLLANLAGYLIASDQLDGAVATIREGIEIHCSRDPEHVIAAISMEHLAVVAAIRGDYARAAMLEAYADAAFKKNGFVRGFTEAASRDRLARLLSVGLSAPELSRLTGEGAAFSSEAAIAIALSLAASSGTTNV